MILSGKNLFLEVNLLGNGDYKMLPLVNSSWQVIIALVIIYSTGIIVIAIKTLQALSFPSDYILYN